MKNTYNKLRIHNILQKFCKYMCVEYTHRVIITNQHIHANIYYKIN